MTIKKHEAVMDILLHTGTVLENAVTFAKGEQVYVEGLPESLEKFAYALESLAKRIEQIKAMN